ncbi:unnamed protein product [Moneuplotes crassus]|uniref:Uncharacterized protein n=1 Tax=Euplotes crassus TaxID=5936 RepID=A0AAD1UCC4_EUPCR|nr:unnamed protein product [Moneuplotes crassus]
MQNKKQTQSIDVNTTRRSMVSNLALNQHFLNVNEKESDEVSISSPRKMFKLDTSKLLQKRLSNRRVKSVVKAKDWLEKAKMYNIFSKVSAAVKKNEPLELDTIGINNTPYVEILKQKEHSTKFGRASPRSTVKNHACLYSISLEHEQNLSRALVSQNKEKAIYKEIRNSLIDLDTNNNKHDERRSKSKEHLLKSLKRLIKNDRTHNRRYLNY